MNTIRQMLYSVIICLLIGVSQLCAQQKYWVYFKDKPTLDYDYRMHLSPAAIEKRQLMGIPLTQFTDIPINVEYLKTMHLKGIKTAVNSKWLNAVSAPLTHEQVAWLKQQRFVLNIIAIKAKETTLSHVTTSIPNNDLVENYGLAVSQMEPKAFEAAKLDGSGIIIGVIDAGFFGAQKNDALQHIFKENRLLGVKDWVTPNKTEHFAKAETFSDWHGAQVLSMIAGYDPTNQEKLGFANQASFYLARTDDGNHEFRGEEDYWIGAMEWMDSLGVRIINTSLGYALGFDDPKENYNPKEMDGHTTAISKAAQIAVDDKGLLLVVSAGNEGSSSWKIVSAPADAQGVVSVGATNRSGLKAGYSSIGPNTLPYLKPDVSCFSNEGTSFSAPVMTGFAACLMQMNPKASNKELMKALHQSAPLYPYGNNYIGYGIPQASRAINLINGKNVVASTVEKKAIGKNKIVLKDLSEEKETVLVFHKSGKYEVNKDQSMKHTKGKLILHRPKDTRRSTLLFSDHTGIEVIWEE